MKATRSAGFTLLEVLAVVAVVAIALSAGFLNLNRLEDPLRTAAGQVTAVLRQSRVRAMATVSAVRVRSGPDGLIAERADRCDATTWAPEPSIAAAALPRGVRLDGRPDPVCFDARGLTGRATAITLRDERERRVTIEVFLGGAVRERP